MRNLSVLIALACLGCNTALSASRTASVLPHERLEVSVSTGANFPVTARDRYYALAKASVKDISNQLSKGGTVAITGDVMSPALVGAGVLLSGFAPRNDEVAIRYGIAQDTDIALRFTRQSLRLESFYQLSRSPLDLSIGLGAAHASIDFGLLGFLSDLGVLELSQTDVDLTLLAGRTWTHGSLYAGPKAIYSRYSASGPLTKQEHISIGVQAGAVEGEFNIQFGHSVLVGGILGGRLTSGSWSLMLEMGVYQSFYTPVAFEMPINLGGLVLYPSGGIALTF